MLSLLSLASLAKPLHWLIDAVEWLFERPVRALVLFLAVAAALGWWRAHSIDGDRDALRLAVQAERDAHEETKARVEAAAQGALDFAEFNRAAVEAKWRAQYQEALHANEILGDRNRALLAQWMRDQHARTDQGGAGGADLPGAADVPAGSVHDASLALVPVADLAAAADAYAQLEALIGFVRGASAVEASPEAPAGDAGAP